MLPLSPTRPYTDTVQGVKQVKKSGLNAKYIFVKPPSMEALEKRLRGRGTDSEEAVQKRLKQAIVELEFSDVPNVHDKVIVNQENQEDQAYAELEEFIFSVLG